MVDGWIAVIFIATIMAALFIGYVWGKYGL